MLVALKKLGSLAKGTSYRLPSTETDGGCAGIATLGL